jgi:hypothetical protein
MSSTDAVQAQEYWKRRFQVTEEVTYPIPPDRPDLPYRHLLCFYTTSSILSVDRTPYKLYKDGTSRIFHVQGPALESGSTSTPGKVIAMVYLDPQWLSQQLDNLEFIVVGRTMVKFDKRFEQVAPWLIEPWPLGQDGPYLMLVERRDGLAYRVQMAPDPLPIEVWNGLELEWKYIVMG